MLLPEFLDDGVLPPGDYEISIAELKESMLVVGPRKQGIRDAATWDSAWRRRLVDNLAALVAQLAQVGITEIFVNGSFVEDKDHPNDIDGYFECDLRRLATGDLQRELNAIDPHKVWTWDPRSRRRDTPKGIVKIGGPA
jgi:hypothetical protein